MPSEAGCAAGSMSEASLGACRPHEGVATLPQWPRAAFSRLLGRARLRGGGCSLLSAVSALVPSRSGGESTKAKQMVRERAGCFSVRAWRGNTKREGGKKGPRGGLRG